MPEGDRSLGLVDIAIDLKWTPDGESGKFRERLWQLEADEPDIWVTVDEESGQVILSGRDEQHLDEVIERLKVEVPINVGVAQVAYRETITKAVEGDYTHQTVRDGAEEFARIKFRIDPREAGGCTFHSFVPAGALPPDYVAAVQKGVESVGRAGPVIGFPIIRLRFTLLDGAHHNGNSSVTAFENAARAGFKDALERASPKILEPIMHAEVVVPELYLGAVVDDLNRRRGQVREAQTRSLAAVIGVEVPLASMFGYLNSLREMSHGTGQYTMAFSHYEQLPSSLDPDDHFPPAMAMRA
jgi:elongation factor G